MQLDTLNAAVGSAGYLLGSEGFVAVDFSFEVFLPAVIAWILGLLIGWFYLGMRLALVVVSIKIGIVLFYVTVFADGSWYTGGDDWGYVIRSIDLHLKGVDPIRIWFTPEGQHLHAYPNSALIKWYNLSLFYFFGPSYFVGLLFFPVLSMSTGFLIYLIFKTSGTSPLMPLFGAIFYLLHWDTITWTSILNLKEPIVIFVLYVAILGASLIPKNITLSSVALIGSFFAFQKIRFYYPFILIASTAFALFLEYRNRVSIKNICLAFMITLFLVAGLFFLEVVNISQVKYALRLADPQNIILGMLRSLLSPLPWKITEPAGYLFVSASLHILLLPITVIGGVLLFNRGFAGKVIVLSWLIGLVAYAVQPVVQSPRHLAPFRSLEIMMQFEVIYLLIQKHIEGIRTRWPKLFCKNLCC